MELSGLTLTTSSPFPSSRLALKPRSISHSRICKNNLTVKAVSSSSNQNPLISTLKSTGIAIVFAAVTFGKYPLIPIARAQTPVVEELGEKEESPLTQFLESSDEAVEALKTLLQEKLEAGEDEESLKLLDKLVDAQPENTEWKFLKARLCSETGRVQESRAVFEEILTLKPLSFEALFENAMLMVKCGEVEKVFERLEEAKKLALDENLMKENRDVRLIMAQMHFLAKEVEEALRIYDELVKEDPNDFRPYFCKGMIYSLLDRNKEAREQFAKYRDLSPKKFEVDGYLRTPLSRLKLFGADEESK